jgi:hypothetical protein
MTTARLSIPCLLAMASVSSLPAQDMTVPLPLGETRLEDIGAQCVAYESYGGKTVAMPGAWVGHFDAVSGISYQPGESVLGTSAILLHSPWRVAPGKAWVDYRLALPQATPIRLSFRIAMRPDIMVPGKSDGVTFGCSVRSEGGERVLLSEHYALGAWKPFEFDLSAYAGQTVVLRLQAEPGPEKNPSFDFSYFGDAVIRVGTAGSDRFVHVEQLQARPSCQAAVAASLVAAANSPARGITPSSLLPATVSVRPEGNAWLLTAVAPDARVTYTYTPATGTLDDVTVQVDEGTPFQPAAGGGLWVVRKAGDAETLEAARGGNLVSIAAEGPAAVAAEWQYEVAGIAFRARWVFGIAGKALTVAVSSETPVVGRLWLGALGAVPLRRVLSVPYLPADWGRGTLHYLPGEHLFACRYLDWSLSAASRCPQSEAVYEPRTDGVRNPLRESGYIAVSPQVCEVLPNVPFPASPYKELLGPRIMLDVWGQHRGTFQGSAANLRDLKDNGIDHLAIISHAWQCFGYDVKLPDHIPANAGLGGDEGMKVFGAAANECGYVWSLHENYIDLYPDAPSYDPTARVLRADGTPSPAWFNAGTGVQSFGLKCSRALGYARQNAPEIHRRYGTTAAYLDVHTCVPPWHQLDHEAGQPLAAMMQAKVRHDRELFQFMRETHGGPLFGEGHNHMYWAGLCDGVEAQVAGGEDHAPFLDFDLLKLHPQMVNHGMGYYERWFRAGYEHRFGHDTGTLEQIDKYRAQELAYGHAGFVGAAQVDNVQWVAREHHLVHPVQRLYGNACVSAILYEVAGRLVPAGVALAVGDLRRQHIAYDSGLRLWVNWGPDPWTVEGRELPQWGFLALGPGTEVHTSLRQGRVADFADCPEFVFADARTAIAMPYLGTSVDIEPRLRELTYLGGRRLRLTYEWQINQELDQDYHCFVHFRNEADTRNRGIVFQQDHEPPQPTSAWRKGQVLLDGPYEIDIPEDAAYADFDLVIGLYKGARVPLKGIASQDCIYIARLLLDRDGGKVTGVRLGALEEVAQRLNAGRADFSVRLNPPGTWVDFGLVATDGSVKINRGPDRLTLFPYPRERQFAVALDLGRLLPGTAIEAGRTRVEACAAGTGAPLGAVPAEFAEGRLRIALGKAGAGRYVVTW